MHLEKFNYLTEISRLTSSVRFLTVDSPELLELHNIVRIIKREISLNGLSQLENGLDTINRLKFICTSTIDTYSSKLDTLFTSSDWSVIESFINNLFEVNYKLELLSDRAFDIVNLLKRGDIINPLQVLADELIIKNKNKKIAVISTYEDVEFKKSYIQQVEFLRPTKFVKEYILYDMVIFIGTPYLYEKFDTLFLGKEVIYISYSFYNNSMEKKKYISLNVDEASTIYKDVHFETDTKTIPPSETFTETRPSEIEQASLNRWIENNEYKKTEESEDNDELINAKIIQLENQKHYLVLPGSSLRVISIIEEKSGSREILVKNTRVENINKNDWIVIKQDTENEYLVKRSKEIYGKSYYEGQMELVLGYKKRLRQKRLSYEKSDDFLRDLKKNDVSVNSILVVKRWIKDTINPRNLQQILEYLDYDDNMISKIIEAANFINRSHRRVGREIGKRLNNYLEKENIPNIEDAMSDDGEYKFYLNNIGSFKMENVKNIMPEEVNVDRKIIYRIIYTNED